MGIRLKTFVVTTLIGGVLVVLPTAILFVVFRWIFVFVRGLNAPLTNIVVKKFGLPTLAADVIVVIVIFIAFFLIGVVIKTRFGKFMHNVVENRILKIAPGYNLIKETVFQILGNSKSPFSTVALAQIFQNETLVTCFVTDEHDNGMVSIFVPTGPNPTSGFIYHLPKQYVRPVNVPIDSAMRSVISCGAGSGKLIEEYNK